MAQHVDKVLLGLQIVEKLADPLKVFRRVHILQQM